MRPGFPSLYIPTVRMVKRQLPKYFSPLIKIAMLGFLVFLVIWQFRPHLAQEPVHTEPPFYWRYDCQDGMCVRSQIPSTKEPQDPRTSSVDVCRLTCGSDGPVWPKPRQIAVSSDVVGTHPSAVSFHLDEVTGDVPRKFLRKAAANVVKLWEVDTGSGPPSKAVPVQVKLKTSSPLLNLTINTDESYMLSLYMLDDGSISVEINGTTVYGVRHGLETLGQLAEGYQGKLFMVNQAVVKDAPTYRHRGLLLDTSRHFIPLEDIKRTLDAMAANKLNVFHWHATDTHSFPVDFPSVPEMARYGAYSNKEIYSVDDMKKIVRYARDRGIRVMFELDTPSHSGNGWQWGQSQGLGNLSVCVNQAPWSTYCVQPPCGQLNPINPNVYNVLGKLYKDIQNLFDTSMFHMGGDEVHFPCWNKTKEITDWMETHGLEKRDANDFFQLWSTFQGLNLKAWDKQAGHSDTPIVLWSSHLTEENVIERFLDPKRYIIETWVEAFDNLPNVLLSKGYKLILATKDTWYFDHGFWGRTQYHTWVDAYENVLPRHDGVLGGEGAMWSELVDTHSLDSKLWPRASALAERLWSDPATSSSYAEPRLLHHRRRLVKKGLHPATITPHWCYQNDGLC